MTPIFPRSYRSAPSHRLTLWMNTKLSCLMYLLSLSVLYAQAEQPPRWDRSNYENTDHSNFRKEKLFQQKVDWKNIDYARMNACLFYLTNEKRDQEDLKLLEYASALEIAAWNHSKSMATLRFFSHQNPKVKVRSSVDQRGRLAGIQNPYIAENIANRSGFFGKNSYLEIAEAFFEQWLNSPGHLQNILSEKALQLGCGVYQEKGSWYATQCYQWFRPIVAAKAKDELP